MLSKRTFFIKEGFLCLITGFVSIPKCLAEIPRYEVDTDLPGVLGNLVKAKVKVHYHNNWFGFFCCLCCHRLQSQFSLSPI